MDDRRDPGHPLWTRSQSAKEKNAVRRAVTALLDELAPERVLKRAEQIRGPVEQHRTPDGCVLQAATAALSVSWFAPGESEAVAGELHIIVWRGRVSRRGSPSPKGATVVTEVILYPIEYPPDDCLWRSGDGTEYDTESLVAHSLALLAKQMAAGRTTDIAE